MRKVDTADGQGVAPGPTILRRIGHIVGLLYAHRAVELDVLPLPRRRRFGSSARLGRPDGCRRLFTGGVLRPLSGVFDGAPACDGWLAARLAPLPLRIWSWLRLNRVPRGLAGKRRSSRFTGARRQIA